MAFKLYNTKNGIIIDTPSGFYKWNGNWESVINRNNLYQKLSDEIKHQQKLRNDFNLENYLANLLPPVDMQEVWAAGVTYKRSKVARMDESKTTGASSFYDKVYEAERPEIFFKTSAFRVIGDHGQVRIRKDSTWNVPEPELTLFICNEGTIEGYTIGNDMSSRSIEGENPLYLPQAKTYNGSCSLGPCLYVPEKPLPGITGIHLQIERDGKEIFVGDAILGQMKRSLIELASWLTRETSFPAGVFLMTGTCLVPEGDFTLQEKDKVTIAIDGIGILNNTVA